MRIFASAMWGLLLLCAGMAGASADKLYRWVDNQGHVHYTQTPPPEAGTHAKPVEIYVAPPDPAAEQAAQQQAVQQQGKQNQAPQAAALPPPPDPVTAAKLQQCNGMHAQLSAYTHSDAPPSAERTQAIADLRAEIAKECD